ncbi:hypothetical protein STENM36S_01274 [Streptomyces tendae]
MSVESGSAFLEAFTATAPSVRFQSAFVRARTSAKLRPATSWCWSVAACSALIGDSVTRSSMSSPSASSNPSTAPVSVPSCAVASLSVPSSPQLRSEVTGAFVVAW